MNAKVERAEKAESEFLTELGEYQYGFHDRR